MKLAARGAIKIKPYPVIERAVETGVTYGWHRAHKYDEKPSPNKIREEIAEAVMAALDDVVDF